MANLINAKTSGTGGLETTADNTGNINIQSGGSTVMQVTSAGVAVTGSLTQNGGAYSTQPTFRNRIINGNMTIDQRNAGASVTAASGAYTYSVDRFAGYAAVASKFTMQQSTTAPTGFVNSALITSSAATTPAAGNAYGFLQRIEGYNIADLGWGTANAKTITISFWVRSSITGTYAVTITNSYGSCYPAEYTISAANTWEQKSVTIAGDTSGTWLTTNVSGAELWFDLGSGSTFYGTANSWNGNLKVRTSSSSNWIGTSGATFYITGVQLEVGTTATDFENLQYGTQLALCQRYYEHSYSQGTIPAALDAEGAFEFAQQVAASSTQYGPSCKFSVVKRTAPTMTYYNWNAAGNQAVNVNTGGVTSGMATRTSGDSSFSITFTTSAGTLAGQTLSMQFTASAEL